ncbi:hypothetical protein [Nonomuraea sp. NPDC052265]|uniref:hypothetical protein n=1 Tax=Nonomuraea sp. NPDC052265 TaxID=3364374 RepID=UPI0037C8F086
MTLTVQDSKHVHDVFGFLLGIPSASGKPHESARALEGALHLAGKAYKTMGAGILPGEIQDRWPRIEEYVRLRGEGHDPVWAVHYVALHKAAAAQGGEGWKQIVRDAAQVVVAITTTRNLVDILAAAGQLSPGVAAQLRAALTPPPDGAGPVGAGR